MTGLPAATLLRLDELISARPELRPLPLVAGSKGDRPLVAIALSPDGLVPLDKQFACGQAIAYEQLERARVTEDVGTRYRVELTLAGEGADLVLLFDSRVVFLMLFSALRAHDVASQFDFTKERQRGASAAGTPKGWRWLAALAGAAAGFALYWHRLDPYDRNTATLGTYAVGAFIALVALGCLMGLFHALYDAGRSEEPLTLAGYSPEPDPAITLDDQPLGTAMIAAETYAGVGNAQSPTPEDGEARQISDIEKLLD